MSSYHVHSYTGINLSSWCVYGLVRTTDGQGCFSPVLEACFGTAFCNLCLSVSMNLGHPWLTSMFQSLLIFDIFLPKFMLLVETMGGGAYDPWNPTVTNLCCWELRPFIYQPQGEGNKSCSSLGHFAKWLIKSNLHRNCSICNWPIQSQTNPSFLSYSSICSRRKLLVLWEDFF